MRGTTKALALAVALLAAPAAMAQGAAAPAPGANPAPPERPAVPAAPAMPGGERPAERSAPPAVGSIPVAGSNSFTEAQARGRIEAAGFTQVEALKKDEQGVWRGQAMRDGKPEQVGLDFQGQVVAGTAAAR
ncbi:PepSY domain-containing protein [Roseomonas sp. 18066]|uniref:PepSY domain-containing protein n=1 Tax=Roseomonas sp. 18066 TaxID=2681412 RepID=UPI00135896A5|nr:PepSY domain-containing protein [Roseomonas sp. 18066]